MPLAVLQFSAGRVAAMSGGRGQPPRPLPLTADEAALPLAILADRGKLHVGRRALAECRIAPQRAFTGFLARLGTDQVYQLDGCRLTPANALRQVIESMLPAFRDVGGVMLVIPSYLRNEQIAILGGLCRDAGLPLIGAIPRCLAWALAAFADHSWHNLGMVIDADEHALLFTMLRPSEPEMVVLGRRILPELALRIWKEKVLGVIADRCVAMSRHDPRESPGADQSLFNQLDRVLDAAGEGKSLPLRIQGDGWFQSLVVTPKEVIRGCGGLVQQFGRVLRSGLRFAEQHLTTASIFLTPDSARLPGLVAEIYRCGESRLPATVVSAASAAGAALALAERVAAGEIPPGVLSPSAPLPLSGTAGTGVLHVPDPLADLLPFPRPRASAANGHP